MVLSAEREEEQASELVVSLKYISPPRYAYLPFVLSRKCDAFCLRHHLILLIFSSISNDLR